MKNKELLFPLCFFLLIILCGNVFAKIPRKGGTLTVCQSVEPSGLDPTANNAAAVDRVVYSNIYDGLIKISSDGRFVSGLAEAWKISKDGKTYIFRLQRYAVFHNGNKFNSTVARWNLERAMSSKTTNPHPEYFKKIAHINTPDNYTLIVELKEPDALFIPHLAEGDSVMLPIGIKNADSRPIGTGPFKFEKWVKGDRIEMKRFRAHWNYKLPHMD